MLQVKGGLKRARLSTMLVAIAASLAIPAVMSATAEAGEGFFCGRPENPITMVQNTNCTGTAYHSNFINITAGSVSGNNACAARSTTPGNLTLGEYSCTGGMYFSAWTCSSASCPGYGSIWKRSSGTGTYYGWYNYR